MEFAILIAVFVIALILVLLTVYKPLDYTYFEKLVN